MEKMVGSEQRKRTRVKLNDRLICFKLYDYLGKVKLDELPLIIAVRDISFGGLGGACKTKLDVGDQATINLVYNDRRMEFNLIVCWCKFNMSFYNVGFRFQGLTKNQVLFLDEFIKSINKTNTRQYRRDGR